MHSYIDKEIYIKLLIGYKDIYPNKLDYNKETFLKLNKALYSLKQSPRLQYKYLYNTFKELGFSLYLYNNRIFINKDLKITILAYIDNLIIISLNKEIITTIINKASKILKIQDLGLINTFLGIEIKRLENSISLN